MMDRMRGGATYRLKGSPAMSFVPDRTALLVIDPVNDFLSEGGADWDMTRRTVQKHDVVGHLKEVIEGARRQEVPVIFGPMAFTAEDYADEQLHRRSGINRMMFERKMFWPARGEPTSIPICSPTRATSSWSLTRGSTCSRPTCRSTLIASALRTWSSRG